MKFFAIPLLFLCVAASSVAQGNVARSVGLSQLRHNFNRVMRVLPGIQRVLDAGDVVINWKRDGVPIDRYIAELALNEPERHRDLLNGGYKILVEGQSDEISFVDMEDPVLALQVLADDMTPPASEKPDKGLASKERRQKALEHAERLGLSEVAKLLRYHGSILSPITDRISD